MDNPSQTANQAQGSGGDFLLIFLIIVIVTTVIIVIVINNRNKEDQGCTSDSDCSSTTPKCNSLNTCVANCSGKGKLCNSDQECCVGFGCNDKGTCTPGSAPSGGGGPVTIDVNKQTISTVVNSKTVYLTFSSDNKGVWSSTAEGTFSLRTDRKLMYDPSSDSQTSSNMFVTRESSGCRLELVDSASKADVVVFTLCNSEITATVDGFPITFNQKSGSSIIEASVYDKNVCKDSSKTAAILTLNDS